MTARPERGGDPGCAQGGINEKAFRRRRPFAATATKRSRLNVRLEIIWEALPQFLPLRLVFELSFLTTRTSIRTTWPLEFVAAETANVLDFLFHDSLLMRS